MSLHSESILIIVFWFMIKKIINVIPNYITWCIILTPAARKRFRVLAQPLHLRKHRIRVCSEEEQHTVYKPH